MWNPDITDHLSILSGMMQHRGPNAKKKKLTLDDFGRYTVVFASVAFNSGPLAVAMSPVPQVLWPWQGLIILIKILLNGKLATVRYSNSFYTNKIQQPWPPLETD